MTQCRLPELCQTYNLDIRNFDLKSKKILSRSVKKRNKCLHIHKSHFCLITMKNRKESLLNGLEEIVNNSNYGKNRTNEDNWSQRIR